MIFHGPPKIKHRQFQLIHWLFFELTKIDPSFLSKLAKDWNSDSAYTYISAERVKTLELSMTVQKGG